MSKEEPFKPFENAILPKNTPLEQGEREEANGFVKAGGLYEATVMKAINSQRNSSGKGFKNSLPYILVFAPSVASIGSKCKKVFGFFAALPAVSYSEDMSVSEIAAQAVSGLSTLSASFSSGEVSVSSALVAASLAGAAVFGAKSMVDGWKDRKVKAALDQEESYDSTVKTLSRFSSEKDLREVYRGYHKGNDYRDKNRARSQGDPQTPYEYGVRLAHRNSVKSDSLVTREARRAGLKTAFEERARETGITFYDNTPRTPPVVETLIASHPEITFDADTLTLEISVNSSDDPTSTSNVADQSAIEVAEDYVFSDYASDGSENLNNSSSDVCKNEDTKDIESGTSKDSELNKDSDSKAKSVLGSSANTRSILAKNAKNRKKAKAKQANQEQLKVETKIRKAKKRAASNSSLISPVSQDDSSPATPSGSSSPSPNLAGASHLGTKAPTSKITANNTTSSKGTVKMDINANVETVQSVAEAVEKFNENVEAAKSELRSAIAASKDGWDDKRSSEVEGELEEALSGVDPSEATEATIAKIKAYAEGLGSL